jgi:CheY-like chemotaxis protein
MSATKILLVNDDEVVRMALAETLEQNGFAVTCATDLVEALKHISSEPYDTLLTNLHISRARDGLPLVNALKYANPSAVTLLLSAFPQLETAAQAILLQVDEILGQTDRRGIARRCHHASGRSWACPQSGNRECWRNFRPDNRSCDRRVVRACPHGLRADVRSDDLRPSLRPSASALPLT